MDLLNIVKNAKISKNEMNKTSIEIKNNSLKLMSQLIIDKREEIIIANKIDIKNAIENNFSDAMIDRLTLDEKRVFDLAENLNNVASLSNPLNKVIDSNKPESGININKITVPMGVILVIYEARPNVTIEALSLSLKSGNATLLRGSYSTINTNKILIDIVKKAGYECGMPSNFVQLIESNDYNDINKLIKMNEYIDLVIPRGGTQLINNVVENSTVPIIETGIGNNYAYIDKSADIDKSVEVIINSKSHRVSVCNSLEKLLIDVTVSSEFISKLNNCFIENKIIVKCCDSLRDYFTNSVKFEDIDYYTEYLDYVIGIRIVDNIEKAIEIINKFSSKHSNLLLSNNYSNIEKFSNEVDSSCVFINSSTRFCDGSEFGLGSEIGISTQKMHVRGPMGLNALTSTKTLIHGKYEIRK